MNDPLMSAQLADALTESTGLASGRYGSAMLGAAPGAMQRLQGAGPGTTGKTVGSALGGVIGAGLGALAGAPQLGAPIGSAIGGIGGSIVDSEMAPDAPDGAGATRARALHLMWTGTA